MSRHYYDLAQLARSETKLQALSDLALLEAVALHKSVFFRAAWANYETARPPTLRLAPAPALEAALRSDYVQMAEMLFDAVEPFDAILETTTAPEAEINSMETLPNSYYFAEMRNRMSYAQVSVGWSIPFYETY